MPSLYELLSRTSRTFALAIPLLPEPTRGATCLSYLILSHRRHAGRRGFLVQGRAPRGARGVEGSPLAVGGLVEWALSFRDGKGSKHEPALARERGRARRSLRRVAPGGAPGALGARAARRRDPAHRARSRPSLGRRHVRDPRTSRRGRQRAHRGSRWPAEVLLRRRRHRRGALDGALRPRLPVARPREGDPRRHPCGVRRRPPAREHLEGRSAGRQRGARLLAPGRPAF